jgi:hypothetical protein
VIISIYYFIKIRRKEKVYDFRTKILNNNDLGVAEAFGLHDHLPPITKMVKSIKPLKLKYWYTPKQMRQFNKKSLDPQKPAIYDGSDVPTYWNQNRIMFLPPRGYECEIIASTRHMTSVKNWYRGHYFDGSEIPFPTHELIQDEKIS